MARGLEFLLEEEDDNYSKFEKIQHRPKTVAKKEDELRKEHNKDRRNNLERYKQKHSR